MPFFGSMIGLFLFMWVGDNYGRKTSIGIAWTTAAVGGILIVITESLPVVYIGLFLSGLGVTPTNFIESILINESNCKKI